MTLEIKSKFQLEKEYRFDPLVPVGQEIKIEKHSYKIVRLLDDQGKRAYSYEAKCEENNHRVCCKIYYSDMLTENWIQEIKKPNSVKSDHFAKYITDGQLKFNNINFNYIFWGWFDGQNLRSYFTKHPDQLNINFIRDLASWILEPLHELKLVESIHGDIHDGNVMIKIAGDEDFDPGSKKFILIDFGISDPSVDILTRDDFKATAILLSKLIFQIDSNNLEPKEKAFYDRFCQHFLKVLSENEPDREHSFKNPRELQRVLMGIWDESQKGKYIVNEDEQKLNNVFEILSADRFPESNSLIWQLYYHIPELYDTMFSGDTVVLTGPRGCGKTMILRNMSLRTHLLKPDNDWNKLNSEKFISFYLSSFELWNVFPKGRIDETKKPEEIADDNYQKRAIHYFHLCWLEEIFTSLSELHNRFGDVVISREGITNLVRFINASFHPIELTPSQHPVYIIKSTIELWRAEYKRKRGVVDAFEGLDFLRDFCKLIRENIPLFENKKIFFLLDDYSEGKITKALQLTLNRIIFQRNPQFQFKVGAEKESIVLRDIDGPLDPSRTYIEHDLGYHIIKPDAKDLRKRLIIKILNQRLQYTTGVKYHDIEIIVGQTQYASNNQLGHVIRKEFEKEEDVAKLFKSPFYHGIQHLANICSGDIASIISLTQNMIITSKFNLNVENNPTPIDYESQNKAITDYSRDFLDRVGGEQKHSDKSRKIAKAFGKAAKWKLEKDISTNQGRKVPYQACRLEVYDDAVFDDEQAKEIFNHLLRYGIFIKEPRGFAQGDTVSLRLFFRKLFAPTFRLTFSNRDCIRIHMNEFIEFLKSPEKTIETMIGRWEEDKRNTMTITEQLDLGLEAEGDD